MCVCVCLPTHITPTVQLQGYLAQPRTISSHHFGSGLLKGEVLPANSRLVRSRQQVQPAGCRGEGGAGERKGGGNGGQDMNWQHKLQQQQIQV